MRRVEIGNYFLDEHILVKAVRDGARFAARQNFSNYSACTGAVADPLLTDTLQRRKNRLSQWRHLRSPSLLGGNDH